MNVNAFLREITRMRLLVTGGFCGRPIQGRHFWLQGSKGRWHGNQMLVKTGQKITKMAITSVVCEISMQILRRGLCYRQFICDTLVLKGQRGVTMTTNFGTKIAINAFIRETTGMWLLITGGLPGRPVWRGHFWLQGSKARCHGNQIVAKIG